MLDLQNLAAELYAARTAVQPVATRPTERDETYSIANGYTTLQELGKLRKAEGVGSPGKKCGFTNQAAWERLGIDEIAWGYLFDDTVVYHPDNKAGFNLSTLVSPRIEPEIIFKLKSTLPTEPDPVKVLESVEWIALGFEIVDNPYPGWAFKPADMVSYFAFHGASLIGAPMELEGRDLAEIAEQIAQFELRLFKNGELVHSGGGRNVLGSPVLSLHRISQILPAGEALQPGDIVTTGTLTDAPPIAPGETWTAEAIGLHLPSFNAVFS